VGNQLYAYMSRVLSDELRAIPVTIRGLV